MFHILLASFFGTFFALSVLTIFAVVCVFVLKRKQAKKLENTLQDFSNSFVGTLSEVSDEVQEDSKTL